MADDTTQVAGVIDDVYPLSTLPTAESILEAVTNILAKPGVECITIEMGKPIRVRWRRPAGDTLIPPPEHGDPDAVLDNAEIVEPRQSGTPIESVVLALGMLCRAGLRPTYLVIGPNSVFRKWLGVGPAVAMYNRLLGLEIKIAKELPEYVLIVLGSPGSRNLSDCTLGVRVNMEEAHE